MKAHEFISRLDEARYGQRRVNEDGKPVAEKPSHDPTSTAQWKTKGGMGKSDDQGEEVKKGYKQPSASIPSPIAKPPSHAPTSGKDYTTTGKGSSDDQGEKISKEAIKEMVNQLTSGDDVDVNAILREGGHKPGCQCGFCKNKGKMGKKADDDEGAGGGSEEVEESAPGHPIAAMTAPPRQPAMASNRMSIRRGLNRASGGAGRMRFHGQVRPKAAINPNQPSMEHLDSAGNLNQAIQEMADNLLEAPGGE